MAMMQEPGVNEPVERLYLRLAAALRQSRANPFGVPVTVAEIYQELVPYRLVRSDAGFDMNADYEHALLRLLAGEGDCVRLEPTGARDAIRRELNSPNPNVGMYREYAGCDVWVVEPAFTPAAGSIFALADDQSADDRPTDDRSADDRRAREPVPGMPTDSSWLDEVDTADDAAAEPADAFAEVAPEDMPGQPDAPPRAEAVVAPPAQPEPPLSAPANVKSESAACAFCDSALPKHRAVRFCPWCGADQTTQPCQACGEALEPGWVFCVACGARPGD